jgi:serine protease Do
MKTYFTACLNGLFRCGGAIALLTLAACGLEQSNPSPKELAEQNKPGTVMIQSVHEAEIAVPDYVVNDAKFSQLQQAIGQQVSQGNITSESQVFAILLEEMFKNPLEYFQPTDQVIYRSAEVTSSGSGSIVTADGYIVTNAHVVSSESDSLKQLLAETALADVVVAGCETELNQDPDIRSMIGQSIGTEEFTQLCTEGLAEYFAHYMKLSEVNTKIYTTIGAVTPDAEVTEGYVSEVKAIGEAAPGRDVAILKINEQNLPTVTTGDDTQLETGDSIYILGYPAAAVTNADSVNEASLTSGLVSARKTMPDDWEVLQTDAAMSQGNSGGPAFNEQGEMIGIATFGAIDSDTGNSVQGVNFVIPMNVISEFLEESNVQPQPSSLSEQYQQGIRLFEQERYGKALEVFRSIHELNPDFPYVQDYISRARSHVDAGDDKTLPTWIYLVAPTGAALLAGSITWYLRKRRQMTPLRLVGSPATSNQTIQVAQADK